MENDGRKYLDAELFQTKVGKFSCVKAQEEKERQSFGCPKLNCQTKTFAKNVGRKEQSFYKRRKECYHL